MTARHVLDIDDLTSEEIERILDLAEREDPPAVLARRGVALLFEKPSARTRNSMELAVFQLGGHPVSLRAEELGIDDREPAEDVARTLAGYHAVIGGRVFHHAVLERMAAAVDVPVVNLLSDAAHPLQALADLLTVRQELGALKGRVIAYVGDGNNVCRSLMLACARTGAAIRVAAPAGYQPSEATVDQARMMGGDVELVSRAEDAVDGADVVYTDVWVSMGQAGESPTRKRAFESFTVGDELLAAAAPDAIFLHCLPAHRGEEVASSVIDGPQSRVWQQAANRLHTSRGLLWWLAAEAG